MFFNLILLLIPALMIVLGVVFTKMPPQKINSLAGYRTDRSMKNQDTWFFANKMCGGFWWKIGLILIVLSLVLFFLIMNLSEDAQGLVILIAILVQTLICVLSIIPVETALKKTFDDQGNRKK